MAMTIQRVAMVLEKYERKFKELLAREAWEDNEQVIHAAGMIPKMRKFFTNGEEDKGFRWLGFLQGILWCNGIYSIEEMRDHNRASRDELRGLGHSLERLASCSACGDLDGCHLWSTVSNVSE